MAERSENNAVRITEKMPELSGMGSRVTEKMPELSEESSRVTEKMPDLQEDKEMWHNAEQKNIERNEKTEDYKSSMDDTMAGIIMPGTILHGENDDYTAVYPIGSGGTADVWRVKISQGTELAAKIYKEQIYKNRHIDDFFNEFHNHNVEGLVQLLDRGKVGNRNFYIMPLYKCKEILDVNFWESDTAEDDIVKCISVLNEALHKMHQSGFFHRDIKPENILYDEKEKKPVLIDLGSVTRGVLDLGYMKSITKNIMRTEGYTAPEIHEFYSGKAKKEVIATDKTDYFALGIVIAEIFKKHEKDNKWISDPMAYRLFENDGDIVEKTADDKIVYPITLENNKRFFNLVEALLRHEKKYRAGYDEVKEWLQGKELIIDHSKYSGKQFEYQFRGQTCRTPEELAEAFATNWEFAKKEIDRGTLKDIFPTFGPYKDYSDQFKDFYDYYGNLNIEGAIDFAVFETIRVLNPALPFAWKGIIYQDGNGNVNLQQLAEAVITDAREQRKDFDPFLMIDDISTNDEYAVYRDGFRKNLQILRNISKKSLERGKYCLAEFFYPSAIVRNLSSGKYDNVDEYLTYIVSLLGEGAFDQVLDNIQRNSNENTNDVFDLLTEYQTTEVVHSLFASAKQMNLPARNTKEEPILAFRSLLELIGQDGNLKKQIVKAIEESNAYYVVRWYLNNIHNYMFINATKGTTIVNKLEQDFQEMKAKMKSNDEDGVTGLLNRIIAFGELLKQFEQYFIYERPLNESGLLCKPDKYTLNYIIPKESKYNLCLANNYYWLPEIVCGELKLRNVHITTASLPSRDDLVKDSVDVTYHVLDRFWNAFVQKFGSNKMEQIASQKQYRIDIKLWISVIGLVVSLLLLREGIDCFNQWRQINTGVDAVFVVSFIDIIVGFFLCVVSLGKLKANWKDKKCFKENKKICEHYLAIKNVLKELNKMQESDYKIRRLSDQAKGIITEAAGLEVNEYYKKHGLSESGLFYFYPTVVKYLIGILFSIVLLCFNILPARNLFFMTNNGDIDSSYEAYLEHEQIFSIFESIDEKISYPILLLNQKKLADSIIDSYNYGNYTDEDFNSKCERFMEIYNGYGTNIKPEITTALSNLVASKKAYEKGEKYISKNKKKKAIAQFVNVIQEDSNYSIAQEYIGSYVSDLQMKQQEAFETNNKDELAEVTEEYRKLVAGSDEDSEIVNTYKILTTYDMEEAALRLVAQQLYKNKEEWIQEDVVRLYCAKADTPGRYYIKVGTEVHGLYALVQSHYYTEYVYLTYGVAEGASVPNNVDYGSNSLATAIFAPDSDIEAYVAKLKQEN